MNELNTLETELLRGLTKKYPSLKSHLAVLKVADRQITATGMVVNFEYESAELDFEDINALFSNEEKIEIKKLKNGLGYVIDVTDGKISHLEFVTYGEKWDGTFADYKIVENI